jgi:AcrR family transcriptional regulator
MRKVLNDTDFLAQLTDLFVREGSNGLTLSEIASRLRCSRRRLYEIAKTKDELFCLVVKRFLAGVMDEAEDQVRKTCDPAEALVLYLEVGVRAAGRVTTAFLRDVDALEPARFTFDRYQEVRATRFCQLIDEGVRQGAFIECHGPVVAEFVLAAAMRLRTHAFLTRTSLTAEEAFREFYRVLLGGLLTKKHKRAVERSSPGSVVEPARASWSEEPAHFVMSKTRLTGEGPKDANGTVLV